MRWNVIPTFITTTREVKMTFEELKQLVSGATERLDPNTVLEAVQGLVEAEKQKGITLYQKKDGELLKLKNSLKETGYDPESGKNFKDYLTELSTKAKASTEAEVTINTLNSKLSDLTEKFAEAQNKQRAAEEASVKDSLKTKLTTLLGDKVYGSKFVIDNLVAKGEVKKIDGKEVWNVDGADVDFNTGLDKFLKNNADIVKSSQAGGTGQPGGSSKSAVDNSKMSVQEALAGVDALAKEYGIKI